MMEIKTEYRGLTLEGVWIYGDLLTPDSECMFNRIKNKQGGDRTVIDDSVGRFTGISDNEGTNVFTDDKVVDLLTSVFYVVKIGFCKKLTFTGVFGVDEFGREVAINNDSDSDRNSMIQVIGNNHQ